MSLRLRVVSLNSDPYTDDIPLSHSHYSTNSFTGYIIKDGSLVGLGRLYRRANSNTAELGDVWISEEYRGKTHKNGQKYSHILLDRILKSAKRRNINKVWLYTTSDNIPAINLYKKFKFKTMKMQSHKKKNIYSKHPFLVGKDLINMVL